jgi:glutamate 5-kinase
VKLLVLQNTLYDNLRFGREAHQWVLMVYSRHSLYVLTGVDSFEGPFHRQEQVECLQQEAQSRVCHMFGKINSVEISPVACTSRLVLTCVNALGKVALKAPWAWKT